MNRFPLIASLVLVLLGAPLVALGTAQSDYRKTYVSDMEAFLEHATANYPFFDAKGIGEGWEDEKKRLLKAAKKCKKDPDFMFLVGEGISYLRDAHMSITECKVEMPAREPTFYSGLSLLQATDGRVIVMHPPRGQGASLKTGMVVLTIDGKDAREVLEKRARETWESGGSFSSLQRARLFEYRLALMGERGKKHTLVCTDGKKKKKVKLSARTEVDGWPRGYNMPEGLERVGKSFYYTELPSGVGYMYLRRVDSSIAEGMGKALGTMKKVKGWVIDLRGNSGGGYGEDLIRQVKAVPGPVAVILDAGCISAGETLARDFVRYSDARLFGTVTAGSSSSKTTWTFPSGIATIKFSTRSRGGIDGKPIEFNGIDPHVVTEAVPEEVMAGENSEILRAEEYILTP